MISIPTVLVLGAGASFPYGYPSGSQLIDNIIQRLGGRGTYTPNYFAELLELKFPEEHIHDFITHLRRSKVRSIDDFLDHRKEFREIGKIAIAQAIIGCEQGNPEIDPLFNVSTGAPNSLLERWYPLLLDAMSCSADTLCDNRLSIVTFNYDRSLEHFLHLSWISKYGPAASPKIIAAIKHLNIVHVHGKLGDLPWEGGKNPRDYGTRKNLEELKNSGELISILYEGDRQSAEFERARERLEQAERVLFLGFGYHKSNLKRLGVRNLDPNRKYILGTRYQVENLEANNKAKEWDALRHLPKVPNVRIHDFLRQAINLDGSVLAIQ